MLANASRQLLHEYNRSLTSRRRRSEGGRCGGSSGSSGRPRRVKRAVVFEPQGLLGLDNLEEDRKVV